MIAMSLAAADLSHPGLLKEGGEKSQDVSVRLVSNALKKIFE